MLTAPTAKVWDHIRPHDGGLRQQWDENVTGFEIIQTISDVSLPLSPQKAVPPGIGPLRSKGSLLGPGGRNVTEDCCQG